MTVSNPTHSRAAGLLLLFLALLAPPASGQTVRQQSYPVSALDIAYPLPHPAHPPLAELLDVEVEMRVTRGGLMQPHPMAEGVRFRLGAIPPGTRIWTTGLHHLTGALLAEFERRGIGGVIITLPDLEEGSGRDLRPPGETRLRVRIWTGRIERVTTVADGSRFRGEREARSNLPDHDWVRRGSPVTAGGEQGLIDARAIEDYGRRLSRHPGRRVDAVLRPGELPGTSVLEYHVAEHKPWLAYAQVTNTGTRDTGHGRQRFGFSHSQLTGRDDILQLDYVTGSFRDVHGVFARYEAPVDPWRRLRLRGFGSWSEYDGSEVGCPDPPPPPPPEPGVPPPPPPPGGDTAFCERFEFSGDQWEAGLRTTGEVLQRGAFFLDLFGTARWREVSVESELLSNGEPREEGFLLAGGGIGLYYDDTITRFDLEAVFETNLDGVAGTDEDRLLDLGRVEADPDFQILSWDGELSFYLEPILWYRRGFGDPGSAARSTLAHEVRVRSLGQWSLGNRLVPQFQQVVGGMHTVRGYRQSVVAGDTAAVGSIEYRLHLARLVDPGGESIELPAVGRFSLRPRTVFGRPDWDVVLKIFYDLGLVLDHDNPFASDAEIVSEEDETLAGWGLGVEVQLLRHVRAGADVAWRRSGLSDGSRPSHDPRFHLSLTLTF